jgi:hypothetical protein
MVQMRNSYKIYVLKLKGRDHSEELVVGGRIILNGNSFGECGFDSSGSG